MIYNVKEIKLNYRKEHPKCEWCIWYKYNSPSSKVPFISCADYAECTLKEQIIRFPKLKGKFCKEYIVEGDF